MAVSGQDLAILLPDKETSVSVSRMVAGPQSRGDFFDVMAFIISFPSRSLMLLR